MQNENKDAIVSKQSDETTPESHKSKEADDANPEADTKSVAPPTDFEAQPIKVNARAEDVSDLKSSPDFTSQISNIKPSIDHRTMSVTQGQRRVDASMMSTDKQSKISKKSKKESTYMDSDFWYYKGVVLNQKGRKWYDSALACYKQALELNKDHVPSIFNLACNYEKLEQYPEAKEWF